MDTFRFGIVSPIWMTGGRVETLPALVSVYAVMVFAVGGILLISWRGWIGRMKAALLIGLIGILGVFSFFLVLFTQ